MTVSVLPPNATPVIDVKSGMVTLPWRRFFESQWIKTGSTNSLTTDNVTETSNNRYFTTARARGAISAASPLSYSTSTGQMSISLGTAANYNIGTSGATVPLLDGVNTFTNAVTAPNYKVSSNQVVGARATGWTASTGTDNRGAYATYAAPTMGAAYNQADVQALADAVQALSRRVKSLETDLTTHGLIGT